MCPCILLAVNSLVCYWVNVCIDVMFVWMFDRNRCIDVHVCMSLYHYTVSDLLQSTTSLTSCSSVLQVGTSQFLYQ